MNQLKFNQLEINQEKFNGPLDVLLSLIEERKMEITDISLANVTDAFLKYVGDLKQTAPEVLADFLVIAARLILIKSKSLLPTLELSNEEEKDINELKERLEIYRLFKEASQNIKEQYQKNSTFSKEFLFNQTPIFYPPENFNYNLLYESFKKIWEEFNNLDETSIEKIKKVIKIEEQIKYLLNILNKTTSSEFNQLVSKKEKIEIVVSFLAILQMFKDQTIIIEQEETFGEIKIALKSQ
ncbi:MAG TPA: segregation/condensation protein A [Candidatus Paceibacterota bacterium]|nr:segregation/condensation protein A [Candidatus Paceibacterota bacterium]HRU36015.1 segregation/condensation protein A [Candidatus Paceibacterota bacterium]